MVQRATIQTLTEYLLSNEIVFTLHPFIRSLPSPFPKPSALLCYTRHYFDNQQNISYSFIQSGKRSNRSRNLSSLSNSIYVPSAGPQREFAVQTVKQLSKSGSSCADTLANCNRLCTTTAVDLGPVPCGQIQKY